MLEGAQSDNTAAIASVDSMRHSLAEYDRKLNSYRAALEAGADPQLIATWTQQVQREREVAAAQIAAMEASTDARPALSRKEIHELVKSFGGLVKILRAADSTDKLEVYRQLGLKMTYNHKTRVVVAEVQPPPPVCTVVVSGGDLNTVSRPPA